jgi:Cu/Ag efflux protein CusF
MHASSAANRQNFKRLLLPVLAIPLIILSASLALADEDEKAPFLGVVLQDITTSMGKALQLDPDQGVMVSEIIKDSAADKAGLEDGDIILEYDGRQIESHNQLTRAIRKTSPGDKVELLVLRAGKEKTLRVEMGEQDKKNRFAWTHAKDGNVIVIDGEDEELHHKLMKLHEDMDLDDIHEDIHVEIIKGLKGDKGFPQVMMKTSKDGNSWSFFGSDRGYMGVHLDDIEGQMADFFEVAETGGALVTEVVADSPAEKAGLKAGDVIIKLDDAKIDSPDALHEAMADTEKDQEVAVQVVRKGDKKTIKVTLAEMDEAVTGMNFFGDDDDHFTIRAPKILYHGKHNPHVRIMGDHDGEGVFEWHSQGEDLDELRGEIKQLKEELKEIKKELQK